MGRWVRNATDVRLRADKAANAHTDANYYPKVGLSQAFRYQPHR